MCLDCVQQRIMGVDRGFDEYLFSLAGSYYIGFSLPAMLAIMF